jgi:hypothetical protein
MPVTPPALFYKELRTTAIKCCGPSRFTKRIQQELFEKLTTKNYLITIGFYKANMILVQKDILSCKYLGISQKSKDILIAFDFMTFNSKKSIKVFFSLFLQNY